PCVAEEDRGKAGELRLAALEEIELLELAPELEELPVGVRPQGVLVAHGLSGHHDVRGRFLVLRRVEGGGERHDRSIRPILWRFEEDVLVLVTGHGVGRYNRTRTVHTGSPAGWGPPQYLRRRRAKAAYVSRKKAANQ